MSYERALKTIRLQPTDRVAQQESFDYPRFMQELVDYDPWEHPQQAYIDCYKKLDVDWIFGLPNRAIKFAQGESSRRGDHGVRYTEWGLSGSNWREEFPIGDIERQQDLGRNDHFLRVELMQEIRQDVLIGRAVDLGKVEVLSAEQHAIPDEEHLDVRVPPSRASR
jgi:hypothetical protein